TRLEPGEAIQAIGDVVLIRLTFNSGGAFGIGQGFPGVFLAASLITLAVVLVLARKIEERSWAVPLGLVLGGGIGNLVDRIVRDTGGRVIDFIDLRVWPVFNLADAAIVTGVITMFLLSFRRRT
ncbi:MAG: signal peptidase II, partial [Actinomycetota bacterium]|nr:signal peptidase II [Actinomycetota bacterium]